MLRNLVCQDSLLEVSVQSGTGPVKRVLEWMLLFGTLAVAVVTTKALHLREILADAVLYTVIVFSVVILALRAAWRRIVFWQNLIPVFMLHLIAVSVVVESFPRDSHGFSLIPFTLMAIVEALLIAGFVWRRTVQSDRPQRHRDEA